MIISELAKYYDVLAEDGSSGISKYGFQVTKANYLAILDKSGELVDIVSFEAVIGKPKEFMLPQSMKIKGISGSLVCDNAAYIFGISITKEHNSNLKTYEHKKFEAGKELHFRLLQNAKSDEAKAMVKFYEKWDVSTAWEHPALLKQYKEKGSVLMGNIVFSFSIEDDYFHDNEEIISVWLQENNRKAYLSGEREGQCSITGRRSTIARLHPQLSGIRGASAMGASVVCYNKPSDLSYNLEQSYNSCVSNEVAFKYTTVLNRMLANSQQKQFIGDDTTVFWALSPATSYAEIFGGLLNFDENEQNAIEEDKVLRSQIKTVLSNGSRGLYSEAKIELDNNTQFYVLGLAPNAGRVSVRYFYSNKFGVFCDMLKMHFDDMRIYGGDKGREIIGINSILFATVSSNSRDKKVNPLLGGAVLRAILTGGQYPQILLSQTILRVKAEKNATQPRAAILKAFFNRKNRKLGKEEEISMYVNKESTDIAYVLGRLFSILEIIQKKALGANINATIKDKYFASACTNPALVFPKLIKLSQHHLAKIEGNYWNIQLGECISLIEAVNFPKILNMDEQGKFILGYYQQTQDNYQSKNKGE